jgi:hypothetical protein
MLILITLKLNLIFSKYCYLLININKRIKKIVLKDQKYLYLLANLLAA